ncbi:bestrophin family protein [Xanthocytophaga agilis]|uniref:Bestrophin family ion channel n=1 Tax=Xanthocytophaga agilis TaxID=3048010 RepID=A0AAE3R0K1_9BACT|nr:bestrophin family ion channel [Xanthocytophaga agilis]MDJ1499407.1 bestrophin family ion channel [Xanthocytophaga agilis]
MLLNKPISLSYFINLIKYDALIIVLYSGIAMVVRHHKYLHSISIPLPVAAIIGTLISLLLAFRISQSYERWWEARIIWGGIVNESRTLIRQVKQFLPADPMAKTHMIDFAERQIIWAFALGESLRKLPFSQKVTTYLNKHELQSNNIPNLLLDKHSEQWQYVSSQYNLDPNKQVQLDSTLVRLTDAMGKCERIKSTVFPKSYSVLIRFIIYVFLTVFPFGLEEVGDIPEIILSILIPLLFIMIEQTSVLMQDPFENRPTDTPVTTIAQTIEINLSEMTSSVMIQKQSPVDSSYYIL